jgi:antirestriction protein ArdC
MAAMNETTGAEYQGKNVDRLEVAEAEFGYDESHGWAGFTQWRSVGRTVKRGQHGVPCMTVINVDEDNSGRTVRKPRGFRVFHYDQTEPLEGE